MKIKPHDCIIIGGGIAGLTAGIYLSRFLINFSIIDNKQSRARTIPRSHNYPGFQKGISGKQIIKRLTEHYETYGPSIIEDTVTELLFDKKKKLFTVHAKNQAYLARYILLATGGKDRQPDLTNIEKIIHRGLLRHCLVCDAYEAREKIIGVLGYGNEGFKTSFILKHYSKKVIFFDLANKGRLNLDKFSYIKKTGIRIVKDPPIKINFKKNYLYIKTKFETFELDTVYSALGMEHNSELAIKLGAKYTAEKCIITDKNKESSIPGLFAIGDVSSGLKQMCVAECEAAVAAHHIFLQLAAL